MPQTAVHLPLPLPATRPDPPNTTSSTRSPHSGSPARLDRRMAHHRQLREHVAGRFAVTAGDRVPGELARAGAPSRRSGTPSLHVSSWRRATGRCRGETPGLAFEGNAGRVGASLQAGEEDGYGSDDAVHDRGRRNLYRWSL